ncbi:DUF885 domain-containing protein [Novosphingobium sp. KACC 22771]|uniref:DUF885 domain-containing protein n=1 Tax=Novosphingobium sp. KACC 22771 TaxID=3025670 RepID=UPI002365D819|nr:DUF885 family protein [Novosphingobium sp. KACC 22771]WDF73143.1 DUF885 family protein [Novosphingobium sp. KACC 22771]
MKRRAFLSSGAGAALAAALPGAARAAGNVSGMGSDKASGKADADFVALTDRIFYERLALAPQDATSIGLDKDERAALRSQLNDRSAAGFERVLADHRRAAAALRAINPATLSPTAAQQRELALWYEDRAIASAKSGIESVEQPYVLSQADGAYFEVPDFLDSQHPVATKEDAEAYLARLDAFDRAIDQDSEKQKSRIARGLVAPGWSLDLTLGQMRALRGAKPEESGMATSLARRSAKAGIAGDWQARAAAIIAAKVYPALDRQIAFVESLKGQTPAGDGIWRVKDGEAIYAAALAEATTTTFTPEEIHKIGLAQVADLSARLDKVLRANGMTQGTIGARLAALNTRADQLYPNTDEGRAALLASLNHSVTAMQQRLGGAFNDPPNDPLEIRRVPVEIQDGAPNGYYYRAPFDGSRPAIYWINLRDTANWPKYGLPDLTYHEGVPGHHLQLSYVRRAGNLPLLLRNTFNSAYTEGWALYAEQVAYELGALPGLDEAGYLQSLLFRATRLVVDTGIHAKRWSREEATRYMMDTTGFVRGRSQSEIERYICLIGQACSYKIGHNVWVAQREKAQKALGAKFDMGWFHDVLKDGILPLAMLERRVDERIAARAKG